MRAPPVIRTRRSRVRAHALVASWLVLLVITTGARAATEDMHQVRIVVRPPACTEPAGLPIVPNDPGTRAGAAVGDCRISGQRELDLRLPSDGYLWLEGLTPDASAWVQIHPPATGQQPPRPAPLGLKLSGAGDTWQLETRRGAAATLTRLPAGQWQPVNAPGGERFWILVDAPPPRRVIGRAD